MSELDSSPVGGATTNFCCREGCDKTASLKCPTCIQLKLPAAYFCSQDCFKQAWSSHKIVHVSTDPISAISTPSSSVDDRFAGFLFTGPLRPGKVSPRREVPAHIPRPDYADDGEPKSERELRGTTNTIVVHTTEEIATLRRVCRFAREVLDMAGRMVRPGITTDEIDAACHDMIIAKGAYPSPLNYRHFPKSICTSINEIICHGIPDNRALQEGDIVNIDVTVYMDGFHGDINDTFFVGKVSPTAEKLVQVTYEALENAIKECRPGFLYREVGPVLSKHVHNNGFQVVRAYCGHGVGRLFHTSPNVPHYPKNKAVGVMKPGHVFTIEPMINEGTWREYLWPDDWTCATRDGKLSAQFEHTIVITETGCEVLTARIDQSYPYPWLKKIDHAPLPKSESAKPIEGEVKSGQGKKKKRNRKKQQK